LNMTYIIW